MTKPMISPEEEHLTIEQLFEVMLATLHIVEDYILRAQGLHDKKMREAQEKVEIK